MRIHQIIIGASQGDAITAMALDLRRSLREVAPGGDYAVHRSPAIKGEVSSIDHFPVSGRRDDIIIYHASFGHPPLTRLLLSRPERLVLVYHNVTPAEFLVDIEPNTAAQLSWGRHELVLLRHRVDLAVAVSSYNAADLATLGYDDVKVLSPGLRPRRLLDKPTNPALEAEIGTRLCAPIIISVAQLLPHKRVDMVIEAFHVLRTHLGVKAALVVVGAAPHEHYLRALHQLANRLTADMLWLTGRLSDEDLATYFRQAAVFVTASEHEGLCLPPLEAMAFGVPVVARANAALPDTIGDAGVLLPGNAGPALLAEAIVEALHDDRLRAHLVAAGKRRLTALDDRDGTAGFLSLLKEVI